MVKINDSTITRFWVYNAVDELVATYTDTIFNSDRQFILNELIIYGSGRLGTYELDSLQYSTKTTLTFDNHKFQLRLGQKRYELSNNIGNVSTVITDRKLIDEEDSGLITSYKADVVSVNDYYPFGKIITERSWKTKDYLFGFNSKSFFYEFKKQDYGFRIYDPEKCRFESVDPLSGEYPWNSTYAFAENSPIESIDLDGLERPSTQGSYSGGYFKEYMPATSTLSGGDTGSKGLSVTNQQNVEIKLQMQANMKANGITVMPTTEALGAPVKQFKVQQTYVSQTQPKKHEVVPTFTTFEKGMMVMNSIINGVTMFGGGKTIAPRGWKNAWQAGTQPRFGAGLNLAPTQYNTTNGQWGAGTSRNKILSPSLFHYTSEQGYNKIMESQVLFPSIGIKNARYGPGQYLTDIQPESATSGQTSARLFGVPWNQKKITHYIELDISGLDIIENKKYNFLVPGESNLDISGRIKSSGTSNFKKNE